MIASPSLSTRAGVIVPRFKHSAVDRNQLKRRLKELIRLRVLPSVHGADLVVRASPPAYDASFDELAAEIDRAVRQLPRVVERLRQDAAQNAATAVVAAEPGLPATGENPPARDQATLPGDG